MNIKGIFQITNWNETADKSFSDESKLSTATVNQKYEGDLQGESELKYQMAYSTNGDASFIGLEIFEGTCHGVTSVLVLKHEGQFENGQAKSQFIIINSIHDSKLIGLTGSFESGENGQANYSIFND